MLISVKVGILVEKSAKKGLSNSKTPAICGQIRVDKANFADTPLMGEKQWQNELDFQRRNIISGVVRHKKRGETANETKNPFGGLFLPGFFVPKRSINIGGIRSFKFFGAENHRFAFLPSVGMCMGVCVCCAVAAFHFGTTTKRKSGAQRSEEEAAYEIFRVFRTRAALSLSR